jgi:hypothetical protein
MQRINDKAVALLPWETIEGSAETDPEYREHAV